MRTGMFFALSLLLGVFAGCESRVREKTDLASVKVDVQTQQACAKGQCPCETPVGTIAHLSKVTLYGKESVACNEGCGKYAEEATCNNGVLDRSPVGKYFKCTVLDCPSCQLGKNLILSGETVNAYKSGTVGCKESCEDIVQRRTCNLGVLSGSSDYGSPTCVRKDCKCSLPDDFGFLTLDGTIKLYSSQNSVCGKTCDTDFSQVRTCVSQTVNNVESFTLNGSPTFKFRSCAEASNCFCTLPNGLGVMANGQIKTISKTLSVACGKSCDAEPNVRVKCANGKFLNVDDPTKSVDFTTSAFQDYKFFCSVQECVSCKVPGTNTSVAHGDKYTFFKTPTVDCGASCQSSDRQCSNGSFLGDTAFNEPQCAKRACECAVDGVAGVKVPVGGTWPFYSAATAICGKTCAQMSGNRTCTETNNAGAYSYVFADSAPYTFSKCNEATGCACALPNGLGQIESGKVVSLTSLETVPCGTTCDQVPSQQVKCDNGILKSVSDGTIISSTDGNYPYRYYCNKPACAECRLKGYGTIPTGETRTLYSKATLGCGDKPESFTYTFKCENAVLLRDGNVYNPDTDPQAPTSWYTSYSTDCPGCKLPWGGTTREGTTVTAYMYFGTVINNCGRGCKSAERKCENGVLGGDPAYTLQACDNACTLEGGGAPPRACLLSWQNTFVTPDSQVPMWSRKSVPCGDSCQNYFKLGTCKMETGTFNVPFNYLYPSCAEICP